MESIGDDTPARPVEVLGCRCVVCGHRWLADIYPARCPRNECRSHLWDGRQPRPVGRPRKKREGDSVPLRANHCRICGGLITRPSSLCSRHEPTD